MAAGGDADNSITFDQLQGIKQPRRVASLLSSLHQAGCDRDKAGNRQPHFDDHVLLILLWLFNPMIDSMIDSMRMLLKVSELPELQTRLGIKRWSLGSFSESCRVRDNSVCEAIEDRPPDNRPETDQVDGDADGPVPAGPGQRRRCIEPVEQTRQNRRETASQRRALEKTGVLIRGRFFF
jgi:hypothetical protein